MKTVARLIFMASMVLAGLSLSAYGVAVAAPGLHVSGLIPNLAVVEPKESPTAPESLSTTDKADDDKMTEAAEPPEVKESAAADAPEATEGSEVRNTHEGTESPETTGSPDVKDGGSQGQNETRGSNSGGESSGSQNGSGGESYQPSRAGWTALPMTNAQAEL